MHSPEPQLASLNLRTRLSVTYDASIPATRSPQWTAHHLLRKLIGPFRISKPQQERTPPTDISSPACLSDSLQTTLTYTAPSSYIGRFGNVYTDWELAL
ncbi:hypothetical protein SK128_000186, partial [Halocaridina rubra]